jgi:hypothetical protein
MPEPKQTENPVQGRVQRHFKPILPALRWTSVEAPRRGGAHNIA